MPVAARSVWATALSGGTQATSQTLFSGSAQYAERPPQKASSGSLRIVPPAARIPSIASSTWSRSSTLIAIDMATPWLGGASVVWPSWAS
jgi:hypothetical protein